MRGLSRPIRKPHAATGRRRAPRIVALCALAALATITGAAPGEDDPALHDEPAAILSDSPAASPTDVLDPAAEPAPNALNLSSDKPAGGNGEPVIKVGPNDRVTMHVAGLPLPEALRMLSEPTKRNIIVAEGVSGTVTASMYDVSFEDALAAMLVSNGLAYRIKGDFVYVYKQEELAKLAAAERKVGSRVFRLTYVNASAVKGLVEPMLSSVGKASVTPPSKTGLGGEKGPSDTEGDSVATPDTLIVTDYVDRLDAIEKVIRELDERPQQVLIETTVLRATLNEDNALGIDFTTVGGIDFTALSSTSPAAQSITTGNTPSAALEETTFTARTDFNSALPAGGFTFGIIKDQIGVFIRALEQITDTNILANPKILALNKQVGQVIVGRRDGYFTTTTTETATVQSVEFLETGTILSFRPFIGDDGYIRMEIHPKDSTGGLTTANLPFEQTTEVTSNVLVKDGHTILVGGLFREVTTATRGQTPVLGNIPIAGALFRRTRDNTVREEVIILMTVHIIKGEQDTRATEELTNGVERFRVGMRRGLQWLGRERLSQAHYRWALQHFENGDVDKALWDADLALHNYPRHAHAMELREKLRGKRDWDSEASDIRTYVRDRIEEEETGTVSPAFGRPPPPFGIPDEIEGPAGLESNQEPAENRPPGGKSRPADKEGRP